MKTQQCPTDGELRGFDSGELAAERFEELAEHLASCTECAARYERLEAWPDRVLDQIRVPLPEEALADD